VVLLFVGRHDESKSPLHHARAARAAIERGAKIHAVFAGRGEQRGAVRAILGPHATCLGPVLQTELAWLYASADLFVFPSTTELYPNAVVEAKSSGLPAIVSAKGGAAQVVLPSDGLVLDVEEPGAWTDAILELAGDRARRTNMGRAARAHIERAWPSWRDVLLEDLLPTWASSARGRRAQARAAT
jgi:glycosyltransferase involved in cell wall biosynthesis